jgi:hypothetical protein
MEEATVFSVEQSICCSKICCRALTTKAFMPKWKQPRPRRATLCAIIAPSTGNIHKVGADAFSNLPLKTELIQRLWPATLCRRRCAPIMRRTIDKGATSCEKYKGSVAGPF